MNKEHRMDESKDDVWYRARLVIEHVRNDDCNRWRTSRRRRWYRWHKEDGVMVWNGCVEKWSAECLRRMRRTRRLVL